VYSREVCTSLLRVTSELIKVDRANGCYSPFAYFASNDCMLTSEYSGSL